MNSVTPRKAKPNTTPWLGKVPDHWEVKRLKYGLSLSNDRLEVDQDEPLPYVGMENIESWTGRLLPLDEGFIPTGTSNRFSQGQVLFGKLRPYLAKATIADRLGVCSTELMVFEPKEFDNRFLLYLILSDGFIKLVDSSTQGSKMPRADWEFIGNIEVAYPPLPEQRAIATYLDERTARIDGLVARQRRLVQLLKEKRQALITRAVTCGLNPNAKMKDSGVPWLGEVPEGWEVIPIRRRATRVQTGSTPPTVNEEYYTDGTVPWYGPSSFNEDIDLGQPVKLISVRAIEEGAARTFAADSVAIVGIGATLGRVAYLPSIVSTNQQVTSITFDRRRVNGRFMAYQLKSFEAVFRGTSPSATLAILDQQAIASFISVFAPKHEQMAIVEFLDQHTNRVDTLITKVEQAISRLQEYRTALISAAVTGKVRVPQ